MFVMEIKLNEKPGIKRIETHYKKTLKILAEALTLLEHFNILQSSACKPFFAHKK